ncbi:MAG: response regulator [Bdellovibrionales bacterium]
MLTPKINEMTPKLASRKWILLAEDDDDLRLVIREAIETHYDFNVKVVEARDGVEASAKLNIQAFDCIITDLKMPKRDGRAFIDWVKRSAMNESTPVIVATGFPDNVIEEKYREIIMLEKPYSTDLLIERLDQQLKLGRLDQRVGAEMLNTLVLVCNEFIKQVALAIPGEIKPEAKKAGDDLRGDIVSSMKVKTSGGTCRLALGFSKELVDNMYSAVSLNATQPPQLLVEVALKVIFKLTGKTFHSMTGIYPTLDERVVFTDRDGPIYKSIKSSKGVVIPIESTKGCLYAHALYTKESK